MRDIFAMHGVISNRSDHEPTHRGLEDIDRFEDFLKSRANKFVDLEVALSGHGDALTIDDSTKASLAAAVLARKHGHAVTLFVNGSNIEGKRPYCFSVVNTVISSCSLLEIVFSGQVWKIGDSQSKELLRGFAKRMWCKCVDDTDIAAFLTGFSTALDVKCPDLPEHLQVMSIDELKMAASAGVRVENHGWTHRDLWYLDEQVIVDDVKRGREWLRQTLGVECVHYAVPYGHALPPCEKVFKYSSSWFTLEKCLFPGEIGPGIFNRTSFSLDYA